MHHRPSRQNKVFANAINIYKHNEYLQVHSENIAPDTIKRRICDAYTGDERNSTFNGGANWFIDSQIDCICRIA